MTIGGIVICVIFSFIVLMLGVAFAFDSDSTTVKAITFVATIGIIIGIFAGAKWYFTNTASGQRALVDQKSELGGGLERTITVYTADGNQIAQYTGEIDIEGNDGGYVLFDFEGKRYTYYNCFVESIAEIE